MRDLQNNHNTDQIVNNEYIIRPPQQPNPNRLDTLNIDQIVNNAQLESNGVYVDTESDKSDSIQKEGGDIDQIITQNPNELTTYGTTDSDSTDMIMTVNDVISMLLSVLE